MNLDRVEILNKVCQSIRNLTNMDQVYVVSREEIDETFIVIDNKHDDIMAISSRLPAGWQERQYLILNKVFANYPKTLPGVISYHGSIEIGFEQFEDFIEMIKGRLGGLYELQ